MTKSIFTHVFLLLATAAFAPSAQAVEELSHRTVYTPCYFRDQVSFAKDSAGNYLYYMDYSVGTQNISPCYPLNTSGCNIGNVAKPVQVLFTVTDAGRYVHSWNFYKNGALSPSSTVPTPKSSLSGYPKSYLVTYSFLASLTSSSSDKIDIVPVLKMISYDLDYEANGGTWKSQPEKQTDVCWSNEISIASASVIERTGYTYQGWNTCTNGTGKAITPGLKCYGGQEFEIDAGSVDADGHTNIILYAQWKANAYTLKLQPGVGIDKIYYRVSSSSAWQSTSVTQDVSVAFDSTWSAYAVAKQRYTYTETSKEKPASGKMTTEGATFAPVAAANVIKVGYDGNGETSGGMSESQFPCDTMCQLAKNGFARVYTVSFDLNATGGSVNPSSASATYAFTGWNNAADGTGDYTYADQAIVSNICGSTGGNVTLYAQWMPASVELPLPTRNGYSFCGWYADRQGRYKVGDAGDAYTPSQKVTLYAKWSADSWALKFVYGTGIARIYYRLGDATAWTPVSGNASVTVPYDTKWSAYAVAQSGYVHTATSRDRPQTGRILSEDAVFAPTAVGKAITITYDGNGKTGGSVSSSVLTYGSTGTLRDNIFQRSYRVTYNVNGSGAVVNPTYGDALYAFQGWNTEPDGSGTSYADRAEVSNLSLGAGVTLYAQWKSAAVVLPEPTWEGHTFLGWSVDATSPSRQDGDIFLFPAGSSYTPTANTTLYAMWDVIDYTLSLVPGKGIAKIYYATGEATSTSLQNWIETTTTTNLLLAYGTKWYAYAVARTGYTYTATSAEHPQSGTMPVEGATFNPVASANTITVIYNGNGTTTSETMSQQQFSYDTPNYLSANKFVRGYTVSFDSNGGSYVADAVAKYAFTNWNDRADGTGSYTYFNNQSVTNPCGSTGGAVVLYAQWDTNNLSCVTLSAPTKDGHNFTGWYSDYALTKYVGRGGDPYTPTQDIKLYAKWDATLYTVTFRDGHKDAGDAIITNKLVAYGDSVEPPTPPEHPYSRFTKWDSTAYEKVTGNVTVRALYEDISYQIYYQSNYRNGQSEKSYTSTKCGPGEQTDEVVLKDAKSMGFAKTGYDFEGWDWNPDATSPEWRVGESITYVVIAQHPDSKIYAIWSPVEYEVSYDGNGATGGTAMDPSTFTYDKAENLSSNTYERAYVVTFDPYFGAVTNAVGETNYNPCATSVYAFASWNKSADGSDKTYSYPDGAITSNICGMAGQDATLYAQWTTNEASVVTLPLPVREGYTFEGWRIKDDEMASWLQAGERYIPTNDTTLVAHWKAIAYPLELRLGLGVTNIWCLGRAYATNAVLWLDFDSDWSAMVYDENGFKEGYQRNETCFKNGTMSTAGDIFAPTGTPNKISVTYDGNGSTGGSTAGSDFRYDVPGTLTSNGFVRVHTVSFKIDSAAIVPFATSNSVYSFTVWNNESKGTGKYTYNDGAAVTNVCDSTGTEASGKSISLYAQWTTNASSVVILPSAPEKEGYSFNGWYLIGGSATNKVGEVGEEYVPAADTTLVGGWTPNPYDLRITVTNGIDEITYATGRKKEAGQNPPWDWKTTSESRTIEGIPFGTEWHAYVSKVKEKEGYVYTGEYVSENNCYTGYVSSVESKNVFAPVATKVEVGKLSLTLGTGIAKICYSVGAEALRVTESDTNVTVASGVEWTAYAVAKPGYATNSTCAASGTMKTDGGAVFAPSADAKTILVTYDGNGKTGGTMKDSNFTYDQEGQLPENGYTRVYAVTFDADGGTITNAVGETNYNPCATSVYQFAGWATSSVDAVSHRVTYEDGAKVKNLSTGDPVTLYAVWTTNESSVVTLPGAKREGSAFAGWEEDAAERRVYMAGATFIPTNTSTFVAQWQIVPVDLSEAVGLTNAVLWAVADRYVRWEAREMQAKNPSLWDWGHTNYVSLVNTNGVKIEESSPLKLYLNLAGRGRLLYAIYKNATKPTVTVVDVCTDNGQVTTNKVITQSHDWKSLVVTNDVGEGAHEICWLVHGEMKSDNRVCLDNMSWTPDVPNNAGGAAATTAAPRLALMRVASSSAAPKFALTTVDAASTGADVLVVDGVTNYYVSVTAGEGGSVQVLDPAGGVLDATEFYSPTGCVLTAVATANAGWRFVGWEDEVEKVGGERTHAFTVDGPVTLRAVFAKVFAVTFDLGDHLVQTGNVELVQSVVSNECATVPGFIVDEGCTFNGWRLVDAASSPRQNEDVLSASSAASHLVVGDTTYVADVTVGEHTLTLGTNTVTAAYGESVTATAPFDEVTVDGTNVVCIGWIGSGNAPASGTSTQTTFTVTGEGTIAWRYETNYWVSVTVDAASLPRQTEKGSVAVLDPAGGVCETNEFWAPVGAELTAIAQVNRGYRFVGWNWRVGDANETFASTAATLPLTVAGPVSAVAVFDDPLKPKYGVTFTLGEHLTRTGGGELEQTVGEGLSAELPVATPDEGWLLKGWRVDEASSARTDVDDEGFLIDAAGYRVREGTVPEVMSAMALTAVATSKVFSVTFDLDEHLTRTGGGELEQRVAYGDSAELPTVEATAPYVFAGWFDEAGNPVDAESLRVITNDRVVFGRETKAVFDVTVAVADDCERMGSVSGSKANVKPGTKVTIKATSKSGYVFAGWYLTGKASSAPVSQAASYSFVMPAADIDYEARFLAKGEDWAAVSVGAVEPEYAKGEEIDPIDVAASGGSLPTVKVTGLPTGLKFTAKDIVNSRTKEITAAANTIYGTPTRSGVYQATVTATTVGKATASTNVTFVIRAAGEYVLKTDVVLVDADVSSASDAIETIASTEVPGKTTGQGVYAAGKKVTLKATANKGYVFSGWYDSAASLVSRLASLALVVPDRDLAYEAAFVETETDAASIRASVNGMALIVPDAIETIASTGKTVATNVSAGVYLEWPVSADALSETTVSVAGLPSGLKFTAKPITSKATQTIGGKRVTTVVTNVPAMTIYGTPTAASKVNARTGEVTPSTVKVTVTTAGKNKAVGVIALTVDPILPALVGTFAGGSTNEPTGSATVTLASTGKISGKWISEGLTWTLSATRLDFMDSGDAIETIASTRYVATNVTAKCGKVVETWTLVFSVNDLGYGTVDAIVPIASDADESSAFALFSATYIPWKTDADLKELAKELRNAAFDVTLDAAGTPRLQGKVGANGTVSVKGTFTVDATSTSRQTSYTATVSSTLVPIGSDDECDRFELFLYYPPKANKFDGFATTLVLRWDGAELVVDK